MNTEELKIVDAFDQIQDAIYVVREVESRVIEYPEVFDGRSDPDEELRLWVDDKLRLVGVICADVRDYTPEVARYVIPPAIPQSLSYAELVSAWLGPLHAASAAIEPFLGASSRCSTEDACFSQSPRWTNRDGRIVRVLIRDYPGITFKNTMNPRFPPRDFRNYGIARLLGIEQNANSPRVAKYLGWLCRGSFNRKEPNPSKYSGYQDGHGYFMNREAAQHWNTNANNLQVATDLYHDWLRTIDMPYGYHGELSNEDLNRLESEIDSDNV